MNKKLVKKKLLETTESKVISSGNTLYQCHYCKVHYESSHLNIDHKTPQSKGGTDDITNLVLSCKKCNTIKDSYSYEEYNFFVETVGQFKYTENIKSLRRRNNPSFKRKFRDLLMSIIIKFRNTK